MVHLFLQKIVEIQIVVYSLRINSVQVCQVHSKPPHIPLILQSYTHPGILGGSSHDL